MPGHRRQASGIHVPYAAYEQKNNIKIKQTTGEIATVNAYTNEITAKQLGRVFYFYICNKNMFIVN